MKFAETRAPVLRALDREGTLLVLPIAAVEQHGPHLPTGTDTLITTALAEALERRRPDRVLLLPTQWLGASDHHLPFRATLTASLPLYQQLLCETAGVLLRDGFRRLLLLNGHGGNIDPMRAVLRRLHVDHPGALLLAGAYWSIAARQIADLMEGGCKTIGHACEAETSLILHLRPELVERAAITGEPDYLADDVEGAFLCRDMGQRTRQGHTGWPELASAEKGRRMFDAIVQRLEAATETFLREPLPTPRAERPAHG